MTKSLTLYLQIIRQFFKGWRRGERFGESKLWNDRGPGPGPGPGQSPAILGDPGPGPGPGPALALTPAPAPAPAMTLSLTPAPAMAKAMFGRGMAAGDRYF